MKSRPRSAEREIARLLSEKFSLVGAKEVKRIPILGREGPDIEINQVGLVIDVKSRIQVPISYIVDKPTYMGNLIGVPLSGIGNDFEVSEKLYKTSVIVERWFEHMDKWRLENHPGGITVIILHRPKLAYAKSIVLFDKNSKEKICKLV